jgi:site-specific DNA recombinase
MPSTNTQVIKAALYARVSTEEQREGQTIDSQIAELERFAREKGWSVVQIYKDDGWSGSILARPELDRLRDDAFKGLFDLVVINDVDRLARDVSHLGIVKRDLERSGLQVVFRKLPAEKSPTYNLMVNILGSFAEFERELIADRTRRGRRHKVEVRKQFLGCNSPYGYRYVAKDKAAGKEGYLEVIPEEAAVVRQMFAWVDKEGLSARKVVSRLGEMKVPPKKGGARWGKSSVLRILRTETYVGVWHYNKYEGCEPRNPTRGGRYKKSLKGSLRRRDKSEWLPVVLPDHLKIIQRDEWERVQRQLDRNITFSPRNAKHDYLLKGLVRCGGCGARYVGDPCHGKFYYRCSARCKQFRTVKEDLLDSTVWEAIKEAILKPSIIADQLAKLYKKKDRSAEAANREQRDIEAMLATLEKEEERVLEAYRTSILSPAQLSKELEKLNSRRAALEESRVRLSKNETAVDFPTIKRSLQDYCKLIAKRLTKFSLQERQRFLQLVINEVVFEGTQVRISGNIPISEMKGTRHSDATLQSEETASISGGRVADILEHSRDYSSSRIENIKAYHHGHNSVEGIPFQISHNLPPSPQSLPELLTEGFLRQSVEAHPDSTLQQLCEIVQQEHGIIASTTTLRRLLKRYQLNQRFLS